MGTNWNSKESKYKPIVKESTKVRAKVARDMFNIEGKGIAEIAEIMQLSVSRIQEYLKDLKDEK